MMTSLRYKKSYDICLSRGWKPEEDSLVNSKFVAKNSRGVVKNPIENVCLLLIKCPRRAKTTTKRNKLFEQRHRWKELTSVRRQVPIIIRQEILQKRDRNRIFRESIVITRSNVNDLFILCGVAMKLVFFFGSFLCCWYGTAAQIAQTVNS